MDNRLCIHPFAIACTLAFSAATRVEAAATDEPSASAEAASTVVVTARKRSEELLDVPVAVTQFSAADLSALGARQFSDYAGHVPGLSYAYGNGSGGGETGTGFANARTIAIRGLAGARTTGLYLDDTPLPGAVDPRLLDLAAVEILRGPQGTLFGESTLGGSVRLLTRAPSLTRNETRGGVELGHTQDGGGLNRAIEAAANRVLAPGQLALRLNAFVSDESGYLTRSFPQHPAQPDGPRTRVDDQGASRSRGASLAALWRASPDLDLTLRLLHQRQNYDQGPPVAYAPLPEFEPRNELDRRVDLQPQARERWTLPIFVLSYRGEGWTLSSSTSHFTRTAFDAEDSTEGSLQFIASYGAGQPPLQAFLWSATRRSTQLTHETRIAFAPQGRFSGVVGFFHRRLDQDRDTPAVYGLDVLGQAGRTLLWEFTDRYHQDDDSLFGEVNVALGRGLAVTLGDRAYRLRQSDRLRFAGALYGPFSSATAGKDSGHSPRLALNFRSAPGSQWYASATRGFRAGASVEDFSIYGCQNQGRTRPDTVWSYEVGTRQVWPQPALSLSAAAYRIDWDNIQQPALDPGCQFYLFANAGAARIDGAEVEFSARPTPRLSLRGSLNWMDARIIDPGASRLRTGERIRQVPELSASLALSYDQPLAHGERLQFGADASYTGGSVSANSIAAPLLRPAYTQLNLRLTWNRAADEYQVGIRNLGNARPNLGDVGYLGYLRYEPDGTTPRPQVATLPPRTLYIAFRTSF